jgi:hypothetical protein
MSDILDLIREKLAAQNPEIQSDIDPVILEVRRLYGGDSPYIKKLPKQVVCRRTLQRRKATKRL